jgi:hypothetical protein
VDPRISTAGPAGSPPAAARVPAPRPSDAPAPLPGPHAAGTGDPPTSPPVGATVRADGPPADLETTGRVASTLVAAGVACAAFGLAVLLAESSETISAALTLSSPVGPLSGKAVAAVAIYVVVWSALHLAWRRRQIGLVRVSWWTCALVLVGLLATFPPVYGVVAGH